MQHIFFIRKYHIFLGSIKDLFAIREQRTIKISIATIQASTDSIQFTRRKQGLQLLLTKTPKNEKKGITPIA